MHFGTLHYRTERDCPHPTVIDFNHTVISLPYLEISPSNKLNIELLNQLLQSVQLRLIKIPHSTPISNLIYSILYL